VTPAPTPKAPKAPSKKEGFSFFASTTKKPIPKKQPIPQSKAKSAPEPAKKGFSFFGSASKKDVPAPKPIIQSKSKAVPEPAKTGFSFFGGGPKKEIPSRVRVGGTTPIKPSVGFFGGGGQKKDNIPIMKKWKQNPDGSITGNVSNSKNFRDGARITTSPVRKGAKAGSVVKTESGSEYRLT